MNNIYRFEGTVPIGKAIPFGLPIVMGVSFTFVTVLSTVSANYGYPAVVGAVLIGGIFEGTLGLFPKYGTGCVCIQCSGSSICSSCSAKSGTSGKHGYSS